MNLPLQASIFIMEYINSPNKCKKSDSQTIPEQYLTVLDIIQSFIIVFWQLVFIKLHWPRNIFKKRMNDNYVF
jgi:hypothetical protein